MKGGEAVLAEVCGRAVLCFLEAGVGAVPRPAALRLATDGLPSEMSSV